jgi:hypothetical protein
MSAQSLNTRLSYWQILPLLLLLALPMSAQAAPACSEVLDLGVRPTWQIRSLLSENRILNSLVKSIIGTSPESRIDLESLSTMLDTAISHPELLQTQAWPGTPEYVQTAQVLRQRLKTFNTANELLLKRKKDSREMIIALGNVLFSDLATSLYDIDLDAKPLNPEELIAAASASLREKSKLENATATPTQAGNAGIARTDSSESIGDFEVATLFNLRGAQGFIPDHPAEALAVIHVTWERLVQSGISQAIEKQTQLFDETVKVTEDALQLLLKKGVNIEQSAPVKQLAAIINHLPLSLDEKLRTTSPQSFTRLTNLRAQLRSIH